MEKTNTLHDVQPMVMELESLVCALQAYIAAGTDTPQQKLNNTETLLIRASELASDISAAFYASKEI